MPGTEKHHPEGAESVLAERRGAVLLLTLNRPERLNAWTPAMQQRYCELLDRAERARGVRAVVVTGAGRGFCAGADMTEQVVWDHRSHTEQHRRLTLPMSMGTPVISAVNGPVSGTGLVTALFTDVRFTAAEASFTTAFSKRGLVAEGGVAWLLPKLVGVSKAMDLLLSARTMTGTEAHEIGLADRVLPGDEVLGAALEYAQALATECSPLSLAEIKRQVYSGLDSGLETAAADAGDRMVSALRGVGAAEGNHGRRERRPPTA